MRREFGESRGFGRIHFSDRKKNIAFLPDSERETSLFYKERLRLLLLLVSEHDTCPRFILW